MWLFNICAAAILVKTINFTVVLISFTEVVTTDITAKDVNILD